MAERGLFTGNRGCLVDDTGQLKRHHNGRLWITCLTTFRDWNHPLDAPRTWTPLFFLDDAVALAAGHRPCGLCRRADYRVYQAAVTAGLRAQGRAPEHGLVLAPELNQRLARERLRSGRGLRRAPDRCLWEARAGSLPDGSIVLDPGLPARVGLVRHGTLAPFGFGGWGPAQALPSETVVQVLTPPTSITALRHGYVPTLHPSAGKTEDG